MDCFYNRFLSFNIVKFTPEKKCRQRIVFLQKKDRRFTNPYEAALWVYCQTDGLETISIQLGLGVYHFRFLDGDMIRYTTDLFLQEWYPPVQVERSKDVYIVLHYNKNNHMVHFSCPHPTSPYLIPLCDDKNSDAWMIEKKHLWELCKGLEDLKFVYSFHSVESFCGVDAKTEQTLLRKIKTETKQIPPLSDVYEPKTVKKPDLNSPYDYSSWLKDLDARIEQKSLEKTTSQNPDIVKSATLSEETVEYPTQSEEALDVFLDILQDTTDMSEWVKIPKLIESSHETKKLFLSFLKSFSLLIPQNKKLEAVLNIKNYEPLISIIDSEVVSTPRPMVYNIFSQSNTDTTPN